MEIYRLWYGIALVLEIIAIITNLTILNSIRAKNLGKVWLIYSMSNSRFIEWKKTSFLSKISWIIFSLIINPLLSWITVILKIYSYINLWIKKWDVPEKIREIQYKLWASLLTKDEVKELLQESANFLWKPITFDDEDGLDEDKNTLILQDDNYEDELSWWYRDVTIEGNKLYRDSHPKDYGSEFTSICEFKIEWLKIYQRLLEKKSDFTWKEYCFVKDWIVLESDILQRCKMGDTLWCKDINELKKECQWDEITFYKVKYFIFKKYPKLISKEELTRYLRSELERIKLGVLMTKKLCEEYKFTIKYSEEIGSYQYEYDEYDESDKKVGEYIDKFNMKLTAVCKKAKCERWEVDQSKEIIQTLEWYLNDEKKW